MKIERRYLSAAASPTCAPATKARKPKPSSTAAACSAVGPLRASVGRSTSASTESSKATSTVVASVAAAIRRLPAGETVFQSKSTPSGTSAGRTSAGTDSEASAGTQLKT